jgi:hypothetical protein
MEAKGHMPADTRDIYVDANPEAYRNFLSDDWAERIESLASPAPKLSALVFDLVLEWRAATYAMSLPAMIPDQIKRYHDAYVTCF